ncbi:MAG: TIGR03790 family protein [Bdellovibrionota bacterium]
MKHLTLRIGLVLFSTLIFQPVSAQNFEELKASDGFGQSVSLLAPRSGIQASELGVIVNTNDPQSVAVADYYIQRRNIPAANVVRVSFPVSYSITEAAFNALKAQVDQAMPTGVQALAVTWTAPWKVDCLSLTTAFAFGFDRAFCNTSGVTCGTTKAITYSAGSTRPKTDHNFRPTMMLAGTNAQNVFNLIDKSISSDRTFPGGDGYFLRTTDTARSVRWSNLQSTASTWNYSGGLNLNYIDNSAGTGLNYIENKSNVLFYLTGLSSVPQITTNSYLPGSVADHLTSYGGNLLGAGQMSILRWLEAGASASYGTAIEPCNYTSKFPVGSSLVSNYFSGNTVIEAYWKSVSMPGEGVFVGEPLARPWGTKITLSGGAASIQTTQLVPGKVYGIYGANTAAGPFTLVQDGISVAKPSRTIATISNVVYPFYKIDLAGSITPPPPPPATLDTTPPTISVTSPSSGAVIAKGANFSVTVSASDNVRVTTVEILIDNKVVGRSTASPFTVSINTKKLKPGAHTLKARAYDAAGNSRDSAVVNIQLVQ